MALALLAAPLAFMGCSSDDDEGDGGATVPAEGVHKIEVSLEGNYSQFTPVLIFGGVKHGGSMSLVYDQSGKSYENMYSANYQGGTVTAQSEKSCFEFYVSIMLSNITGQPGSVTVNCRGFVDGKVSKSGSQTVSFKDGEMAKAAYFNSLSGFRDVDVPK